MRSTAPPNFTEWVPWVQEASSYSWNEFQKKWSPLRGPPRKFVRPNTSTRVVDVPGKTDSEGSFATGLIAETVALTAAASRLKPKRAEFTRRGLKTCVSSSVAIWRLVSEFNSASLSASGVLYGVMSPRYVTTKVSLSDSLSSTRMVPKFSVTTCWPATVKRPMSPFEPGLMPDLGKD